MSNIMTKDFPIVTPNLNDLALITQDGKTRNSTFQKIADTLLGTETLQTTAKGIKGAINEVNQKASDINSQLKDIMQDISTLRNKELIYITRDVSLTGSQEISIANLDRFLIQGTLGNKVCLGHYKKSANSTCITTFQSGFTLDAQSSLRFYGDTSNDWAKASMAIDSANKKLVLNWTNNGTITGTAKLVLIQI